MGHPHIEVAGPRIYHQGSADLIEDEIHRASREPVIATLEVGAQLGGTAPAA